jgi:hypothetical protein
VTYLPAEAHRISYAPEGLPKYEIPEQCAAPGCDYDAFERHHVVRRSYTQGVGPQDYTVIDGELLPNLVGLCRHHHFEITNNKSRISYMGHQFFWSENQSAIGKPLNPVPLSGPSLSPPDALTARIPRAGVTEREREREGENSVDVREPNSRSQDSEGQVGDSDAADGARASRRPAASSETCPTCNRKLPKPKAEQEAPRPKVTWAIRVPKDAQEDGYELLRSLVEQCQEQLGREGEPPYYALVELMWFFLNSTKERSE